MTTSLLTLTDNAAGKAKTLLAKLGKPQAALRVKVISGGCSGLEYQIQPDENPPNPLDSIIEIKGVRIYLDPKGLLYVAGSEMDYVSSLSGSGFRFKNPNAVAECSCGDSFSV